MRSLKARHLFRTSAYVTVLQCTAHVHKQKGHRGRYIRKPSKLTKRRTYPLGLPPPLHSSSESEATFSVFQQVSTVTWKADKMIAGIFSWRHIVPVTCAVCSRCSLRIQLVLWGQMRKNGPVEALEMKQMTRLPAACGFSARSVFFS